VGGGKSVKSEIITIEILR